MYHRIRAFTVHVSAALLLATGRASSMPAARISSLPTLPTPGEPFQAGIDYFVLFSPRAPVKNPGKVEVMIRHQYTVRECRSFEPALEAWLKNKPSYIEVVRKPHVHYPHARFQARMFLTMQARGYEKIAVTKLYDWMWHPTRYPIYHNLYNPNAAAIDKLNMQFVESNGLDIASFLRLYNSAEMDKAVIDAEADSLWDGDAMIVINSRYATDIERTAHGNTARAMTPENYARLFLLIESLGAAELRRK